MGFLISTTIVQGIFERACMWSLGRVMDLIYFTWSFSLVLAKQLHFGQSHPPIPPHLSFVAPFIRLTMLMQGEGGAGVMLQQNNYIFGNYGINDAKGHLWMRNIKLVMWGCQDMMATFNVLHNDYMPCL